VVLFCPDGSISGGAAQPEAGAGSVSIPLGAREKGGRGGGGTDGGKGWLGRCRSGWLFRAWSGRILLALSLVAVAIAGSLIGIRHVYFLGVEDGFVTIYQGVPVSLGPWDLYSSRLKSMVRISDLRPYEQDRINNQDLHSYATAQAIIDNYAAEMKDRQEADSRQQTATSSTTTAPPPGGAP